MGLHWVEQAALEAQAEIAAASAAADQQKQQQQQQQQQQRGRGRRDRRDDGPKTEDRVALEQRSGDHECERHWSHSDELDELVRLVGRSHAAAADEAYQTQMRQQLTVELQQIQLQLTQAAGWETRSAVPMLPRDAQWRRCAHQIAASLGLSTRSQGDGNERHVVVSRQNHGNVNCSSSDIPAAERSSTGSDGGGVAGLLRQQFDRGSLCWGRCIDYRCTQRRHGRTLLMECARAGVTNALQALLKSGTISSSANAVAPVNTQSLEGFTALHYASYCGHTAAVHALLTAGADVNLKNAQGETAEGAAQAGGHEHVVQILAAWTQAQQCVQRDVNSGQTHDFNDLEEGEVCEKTPVESAAIPQVASATPDVTGNWLRQLRPPATYLQVLSSDAKGVSAGLSVTLKPGTEKVAGRSRSQQIVLRDLEVSTAHATIGLGVGGAGLWISDIGSNNGTFVNGARLSDRKLISKRRALFIGDELQIGSTLFKAMAQEPPTPVAPPSSAAPSESTANPDARERTLMDASVSAAASFTLNPSLGKHALALQTSDILRSRKSKRMTKQDSYEAPRLNTDRRPVKSDVSPSSYASARPIEDEQAGIGGVGQEILEKMGWKRGAGLGKGRPMPVLDGRTSAVGDRLGLGATRPITDQLGLRPGAGLAGATGSSGCSTTTSGRVSREQRREESLQLTRARFDALDDTDSA